MAIQTSFRFFCRLCRGMSAFRRNVKGAAAVEFAFIVPILLLMYLGSMEISQALDVDKRVSKTASEVADLVTQQQSVTQSELIAIMKIGAATIEPYDRDTPTITVTAIQVDTSKAPKATVVWSLRRHDSSVTTPVAAGTAAKLPNQLLTAGAFFIEVNVSLEYLPITSWAVKTNTLDSSSSLFTIPLSETYYLRPRLTATVNCSDCPGSASSSSNGAGSSGTNSAGSSGTNNGGSDGSNGGGSDTSNHEHSGGTGSGDSNGYNNGGSDSWLRTTINW